MSAAYAIIHLISEPWTLAMTKAYSISILGHKSTHWVGLLGPLGLKRSHSTLHWAHFSPLCSGSMGHIQLYMRLCKFYNIFSPL